MIRGLYNAASGMKVSLHKQNAISNNLANINTTGYKKGINVQKAFSDQLMARMDKQVTNIGEAGRGVGVSHTAVDHSGGEYKKTGNELDWAIKGEGFFAVQTPQGVRYTRNGDFTINNQGQIVTQEGHPVLGEQGSLQLPPESESITVKGNTLLADGEEINTIQIRDFPNKSGLAREGDSLFRWTPEAGGNFAGTGQVAQGFLEGSNVNPVQEMTKMIENSRKYQADQKMVQAHNQTLGKAVNQVGKV